MRLRVITCIVGLAVLGGWSAWPDPRPNQSGWVTYPTHRLFAAQSGILATSQGLIWLTARGGFIRMTRDGTYTLVRSGGCDPYSLAEGADRRIYAMATCWGHDAVLAVTPDGVLSAYVPRSDNGINDGMVLGPDGNIWFSEFSHIGRLRPDGTLTEYKVPLPQGQSVNTTVGIGAEAGKLWFGIYMTSYPWNGYLVSVDPYTGDATKTQVPCFDPTSVVGAAGAIWAKCGIAWSTKSFILRMTPDGSSTLYPIPAGFAYTGAQSLIAGRKNLWFVGPSSRSGDLRSFNLTTHRLDSYPPPRSMTLSGLAFSPSGHIWANLFDNGYPAAAIFDER
jgi:virginiamycin B lyase